MTVDSINLALKKCNFKMGMYSLISVIGFALAFSSDLYLFTCDNLIQMKRDVFMGLVLISMGLLSYGLIIFSAFKELPKCSNCNKKLHSNQLQLVIATKNCPHCGSQLISTVI